MTVRPLTKRLISLLDRYALTPQSTAPAVEYCGRRNYPFPAPCNFDVLLLVCTLLVRFPPCPKRITWIISEQEMQSIQIQLRTYTNLPDADIMISCSLGCYFGFLSLYLNFFFFFKSSLLKWDCHCVKWKRTWLYH